jgi:hypothetical protein
MRRAGGTCPSGSTQSRLGTGRHEHRCLAVLDLEPFERALGDERVCVRSDACDTAAQAPHLRDRRLGERSASLHAAQRRPPDELVLTRHRRLEHVCRQHALRQVVQTLEAVAARNREPARGVQRFEHDLRRLPVPHPARPGALEVARAERAALTDLAQYLVGQLGLALEDVAAPRMRLGEARHPPAVHRIVLDRNETRFVRPVLEDAAGLHQLRHGRFRIGADSRAERDSVASVDRRDRVELDAAEALHGREHLGGSAAAGAGRVALRLHHAAADLCEADGRGGLLHLRTQAVATASTARPRGGVRA